MLQLPPEAGGRGTLSDDSFQDGGPSRGDFYYCESF